MILAAMALVLAASSCRPARAAGGEPHRLKIGGFERDYLVHKPPQWRADGPPLPVVIALHGGGGSAADMEKRYGLDAYADRYGMIVVYPDGIPSAFGKFHTWNAGNCCGRAKRLNVDDVGFISAVIDAVTRRENGDPLRVFVTGHSNGGQMSYRLACEIPRKIAAIAPVAGYDFTPDCPSARKVPVLHIHGTLDRCLPYHGSDACGACFSDALGIPAVDPPRTCEGVRELVGRRAAAYGCSSRTRVIERRGPVVCENWDGCPASAPITLCTIEGAGHEWQGSSPMQACVRRPDGRLCRAWNEEVGPSVAGVDVDLMIFDFFRRR